MTLTILWRQLDTAYGVFETLMLEDTPENKLVKGNRVEKEFLLFKVELKLMIGSNNTTLYIYLATHRAKVQVLHHIDAFWSTGQALEHMLKLVKGTLQGHTNHQLRIEKMDKGRTYR